MLDSANLPPTGWLPTRKGRSGPPVEDGTESLADERRRMAKEAAERIMRAVEDLRVERTGPAGRQEGAARLPDERSARRAS